MLQLQLNLVFVITAVMMVINAAQLVVDVAKMVTRRRSSR
ncbi:hypothetical protein STSO111631_21435 [Stackebrandtia soli]